MASSQLRDLAADYANLNAALRESWGLLPVEPSQETPGYSLLLNGSVLEIKRKYGEDYYQCKR